MKSGEHKPPVRSGRSELAEAELPLIPGQREPASHDLIQREAWPPEPAVAGFDDEIDTDVGEILAATLDDDAPGSSVDLLTPALSERDRGILTFEKQSWRYTGSKEQAIRDRFQVSATRYYQLLNALLDHPAALEFDPMLVGRLRRLRGSRARARRR